MPVNIGRLELHMGPTELDAKDDLERAIIEFIDRAGNSLEIAVQELESVPIAEAIVRARGRGVSVRVILEQDYLVAKSVQLDPWTASGQHERNREIYAAMMRAKIPVNTDLNPAIFHQKFIVRDWRHSTRAAVLTGSTNFTPTGTGKAPKGGNLNHIVVIGGKRFAGVYHREFEELASGTFGQKRERHDEPPRTYRVSSVKVKALFAPEHSPEMEIMKQMLKARARIDFAIFTFAQSSGIDDTMLALARAGISIRGVIDGMAVNQKWAPTKALLAAGVDLRAARHTSTLNKLHHKLMVIDGQVVIAGSFNYTEPATALNDENIVVIGDLSEQNAKAKTNQRKLAKYAQDEINRIYETFGVTPRRGALVI